MARKDGVNRGIRELPPGSGIWWVDIWHEGKRIRKKVGSKSAARATCDRLKTESREGRLGPRPVKKHDPTFRELVEMYARYAKIHHKRKGGDTYRIRRWLDAFGDKSALSIKPHMLEEIIAKMIDKGYKPATIARELVILKAIFNRAIKNELIERNPIARVSAPKFDNTLVRYLTPEQEERLFNTLPERLHPIVTVALHTGLRQGELLKLNWEDVDFNAGTLFVRDRKSGESTHVHMNSRVKEVICALRKQENFEGAIFTNRLGGRMDSRNLRRDFKHAIVKAGLTPFRFHDLRHSFASRLAMQGANDRTLQTLMGHKSQRMILRYAHLGPTHLLNALEGLVKDSPPKIGTDTKTDTREILRIGGEPKIAESIENTGAGNGIRTRDPRLGKTILGSNLRAGFPQFPYFKPFSSLSYLRCNP